MASVGALGIGKIMRPLLNGGASCYWRNPTRTFLFAKEKDFDRDFISRLQNPTELSVKSLKRIMKERKEQAIKDSQSYIAIRHQVLGPELATAHFVIARGGAVKLVGHDRWYVLEDGQVPLPRRRRKDMFVEAIDASGMNLMCHAFDNFRDLKCIQYLNLSNCPNIDDWCLDRFTQFRETLVYLDISRCPGITERGLAALHRLEKLRYLQVYDMPGVQYKPLVAIMLEEALPNCVIDGIDYTDRTELDQTTSQTLQDTDPFLAGYSSIHKDYELHRKQESIEDPSRMSKIHQ